MIGIEGATVPVISTIAALVISIVFRLALWKAALLSTIPLLMLFLDLPLSPKYLNQPLYRVAVGWGTLLPVLAGVTLSRWVRSPFRFGFRAARIAVRLGVWLATIVVLFLYLRPQYLDLVAPSWRGSLGIALLVLTLFAFTISLIRSFRSFALASLLLFVSLTLATEIFLQKLPSEVFTPELFEISELSRPQRLPADEVPPQLDSIRVGLVSLVDHNVGEVSSKLSHFINQEAPQYKLQVRAFGGSDETLYKFVERHGDALRRFQPEILFVSGGPNESGMPAAHGLTEKELDLYVQYKAKLEGFPFAQFISDSRLVNMIALTLIKGVRPQYQVSSRVSPNEFESEILAILNLAQAIEAKVILVENPILSRVHRAPDENPYTSILNTVAAQRSLPFVILRDSFDASPLYDHFAGIQLTKAGSALVAERLGAEILKGGFVEVNRNSPRILHSVLLQGEVMRHTISARVKVSEGQGPHKVRISVNGEDFASRKVEQTEVETKFILPDVYHSIPAAELALVVLDKDGTPVKSEVELVMGG